MESVSHFLKNRRSVTLILNHLMNIDEKKFIDNKLN